MPLEVQTSEYQQVRILGLAGEVDTRTSGELEKALLAAAQEKGVSVLLDFSSLEFISSAGLRVLVMTGKRLAADGGQLALCGLSATIRRVFDIAGMSQLFAIHAGRGEAIEWLESSAKRSQISSLAGSLLRKSDKAGGSRRGGGDAEKSSLAAELLKKDEEA